MTETELGGKSLPVESFANMVLDIGHNSYQLIDKEIIDSGIAELIDGSEPKAHNIIGLFGPIKRKIYKCIYRFEGET